MEKLGPLQEKVNRILDLMITGLEKGADVVSKELPLLLEEYSRIFMVDAIPLGATFGFLFFATFTYFWWRYAIKFQGSDPEPNTRNERSDGQCFFYVSKFFVLGAFILASLTGFIPGTVDGFKEMVKIEIAPKAYLIEKFRK